MILQPVFRSAATCGFPEGRPGKNFPWTENPEDVVAGSAQEKGCGGNSAVLFSRKPKGDRISEKTIDIERFC
jgi:hypothetical protein